LNVNILNAIEQGFEGRSPRPRARRRRAQERVAERSRTVAAARLQPCEGTAPRLQRVLDI
jgi:hypothetical protein